MVKKPIFRTNPEAAIQAKVVTFLEDRGWLVERMHGNAFQHGIPDLFAWHRQHGFRWIDIKCPHRNRLTVRQCQKWPVWEACGLGVWIMVAATDEEYQKLFSPPNFRDYWKNSYNQYTRPVKEIIDPISE